MTRRVGVGFFFLDEVGAEQDRDVVLAESRRLENQDEAGRRGRLESESESESSYRELEEYGLPFESFNSDKYCVRVVTIAPWVNFRWMLGSWERRSLREIQKISWE